MNFQVVSASERCAPTAPAYVRLGSLQPDLLDRKSAPGSARWGELQTNRVLSLGWFGNRRIR